MSDGCGMSEGPVRMWKVLGEMRAGEGPGEPAARGGGSNSTQHDQGWSPWGGGLGRTCPSALAFTPPFIHICSISREEMPLQNLSRGPVGTSVL